MVRFVSFVVVVSGLLACANVQALVEGTPDVPMAPDPLPAEVTGDDAAAPAATGGTGNAASCRRYIEATNKAPCMSAMNLDASTLCSDALDQMPCDLSKYYDCMADNTKCNGPVPDLAGQASCGTPTCG